MGDVRVGIPYIPYLDAVIIAELIGEIGCMNVRSADERHPYRRLLGNHTGGRDCQRAGGNHSSHSETTDPAWYPI